MLVPHSQMLTTHNQLKRVGTTGGKKMVTLLRRSKVEIRPKIKIREKHFRSFFHRPMSPVNYILVMHSRQQYKTLLFDGNYKHNRGARFGTLVDIWATFRTILQIMKFGYFSGDFSKIVKKSGLTGFKLDFQSFDWIFIWEAFDVSLEILKLL